MPAFARSALVLRFATLAAIATLAPGALLVTACASRPRPAPAHAAQVGSPSPSLDARVAPTVRRLGEPGWVEVVAEVVAPESEAPAEARARALAEARRAAIESVAGIRVRSSLLSYEGVRESDASSLVQSLTASRADAMVLDERLAGSEMTPLAGRGYRMRVVLRARVLDRSTAGDPGFRLQMRIDRERFLAGEDVALSVRASRDARIYVLGISEDSAAVLLPNKWLADTRTEAGEWIRFPDGALRERGVRLVAQVPDGKDSAVEALVAVALRGDLELDNWMPSRGDAFRASDAQGAGRMLADLLAPLSDLPPDSWTFDQVVYEVYAR